MRLSKFLFASALIAAFLFCLQFVSASSGSFDGFLSGMQDGIRLVLGDISVSGASLSEVFFIKLLVFFLLVAIINFVLLRVPTFKGNTGICLLISVIVSLIAVRYMTTESLINFIWLPYGWLGVVLSVLLPFIIAFYFIESFDSAVIRKVGWVVMLVIFAGLGLMRWDTLSTGGEWYQNLAWLYVIIAVLSAIIFLFDKEIRVLMLMSSLNSVEDVNKRAEAARVTAQIEQDRAVLSQVSDPNAMRAIEERIRQNKKRIKAILRS